MAIRRQCTNEHVWIHTDLVKWSPNKSMHICTKVVRHDAVSDHCRFFFLWCRAQKSCSSLLATAQMVRLTAELILSSPAYVNPLKQRELDLRGILSTLSLPLPKLSFLYIISLNSQQETRSPWLKILEPPRFVSNGVTKTYLIRINTMFWIFLTMTLSK